MNLEQTLVDLELAVRAGDVHKAVELAFAYTDWRGKKFNFTPKNGDVEFASLLATFLGDVTRLAERFIERAEGTPTIMAANPMSLHYRVLCEEPAAETEQQKPSEEV